MRKGSLQHTNTVEEKVLKRVWKFYDRDGHMEWTADPETADEILNKGKRIKFSYPVQGDCYVHFEGVRRRPMRVEVVTTLERTEEILCKAH